MSDDAYSLVMALTCLAYVGVLYFRWRRRRALKKLLRELERANAERVPIQ